jgi:hypothetical protein
MAKASTDSPTDKFALYEKVVATLGLSPKGATVPYTSVNGHMFSYLSKSGTVALRLPPEARETFLKKYKATLCKQYGVVQKEYVDVPDALLKKTTELKKFFALSLAYVSAMKPKPTAKKKSA